MTPSAPSVDRRTQILHAATTLFCQNGFDGTPIRAVARECRITEAAIHRHFRNEAHL